MKHRFKPTLPVTQKMLDHLLRTCSAAGEMQLKLQPTAAASMVSKADGSPVCDADTKAQAMLVRAIRSHIPDAAIVSEEQSEEANLAAIRSPGYVWTIDPLDGTKNYLNNTGDHSIQIGLLGPPENGIRKPVFGIVYMPATNTVYYTGLRGKALTGTLAVDNVHSVFEGYPKPLEGPDQLPGLAQPGHSPEHLRIGIGRQQADAGRPCKFFDEVTAAPRVHYADSRSMQVVAGTLDAAYCDHPLYIWDVAAIDAIARAGNRLMLPIDIQSKQVTADSFNYNGERYDGAHALDWSKDSQGSENTTHKPRGEHFKVPPYVTISKPLLQHIPHPPSLDRPAERSRA